MPLSPTGVRLPLLTVAAAALSILAGCGSASTAASGGNVAARVGDLEILHPYLPDPASPSVAAVYLTVRNDGSHPDRLLTVTSTSAAHSMLMTEDDQGGTGTMAPLRGLAIPAHGEASLVPGRDHVMLEGPERVHVGGHVSVTLRFETAGSVTVEVPVVPLSAIVGNDGSPVTTGMGAMGGMDMGTAP
jgi:copper(I)-binding protein